MVRTSGRTRTPSRLLADFSTKDDDGAAVPQQLPPAKRRRALPPNPPSDGSDDDAEPTPSPRGTAADRRRHEAVEAAEAQKVCDVAEVASIVTEELGPWLGAIDVAALLRERAAAGEDVHAAALGLARDAIIAELRQRALAKDVDAPRVERLILSLCAKASDSEVEARRNTAAAVKRGLYGHAAAFAGTQDGPVNASEHFGNGGTGRATLIAWPRHDASKAMDVPADAPQAPHLEYVHA